MKLRFLLACGLVVAPSAGYAESQAVRSKGGELVCTSFAATREAYQAVLNQDDKWLARIEQCGHLNAGLKMYLGTNLETFDISEVYVFQHGDDARPEKYYAIGQLIRRSFSDPVADKKAADVAQKAQAQHDAAAADKAQKEFAQEQISHNAEERCRLIERMQRDIEAGRLTPSDAASIKAQGNMIEGGYEVLRGVIAVPLTREGCPAAFS